MIVPLSYISEGLELIILGEENQMETISDEEVIELGEAKHQLKEGCFYEYQFVQNKESASFKFTDSSKNKIINKSRFSENKGNIQPNIHVGTHNLEITDFRETITGIVPIEVSSVKAGYRSDYRTMLESITEKCTDLIMQIDSPIEQQFETDYNKDPQTLYQRFSFVKSIIGSEEFEEAVLKIISSPTCKWQEEHEQKDVRRIKRFDQKSIKQIISKNNRVALPSFHFLPRLYKIESIPAYVDSFRKTESIDTAENRFIKHALSEFLFFCENCKDKFIKYSRARAEANGLTDKITNLLSHQFFKDISKPTSLVLNSPVLQRKSGYREVLIVWLKFDLAAKLIWNGGDEVYGAGKKDIAVLYEYWLFFTLLDLFKEIFDIEPESIDKLIQYKKDNLSLSLKQGNTIALEGIYQSPSRSLNIQFSYNRSFGGGKKYPLGGSYTTTLRPDYTLSIWPEDIKSAKEAEEKEIITHIHFDAKYKVDNFYKLILTSKEEELSDDENKALIKDEEEEKEKGTYKNQDLLKMHAYKDAIRRTGGAYVLYPGEGKDDPFRGFHELIPGLGAFVVKPSKEVSSLNHLKLFIIKVIENFKDRASQRERTAIKVYDIHRRLKEDDNVLNELIPEYFDSEKKQKVIPDETSILLGYYKTETHLEWIRSEYLYNIRYGHKYSLSSNHVTAKYLLLYTKDKKESNLFFKLKPEGPRLYSKDELINILKYPTSPSEPMYLVYTLENEIDPEFIDITLDLTKFESLGENKKPRTISLTELMMNVKKSD